MSRRIACPRCHSANKIPVVAQGVEGVYRCGKCRYGLYRVEPYWKRTVAQHLAVKHRAEALEVLLRVIQQDMPLFWRSPMIFEERRAAWLYRIQLLQEEGQLGEALAWICLECDITPDDATAKAVRDQLKRELCLVFDKPPAGGGATSSGRLTPVDEWPGVAGMRELKAILYRDVILPHQEPELYARYGLTLPNGILLYGPPGCGKTFIARQLAARLKMEFIEVNPADLASIYVHGTQQQIGQLFAQARAKAPAVLFFDEFDALVPKRTAWDVGHHYGMEVNQFLVELNECATQRVLVIAATNQPDMIDPAILRPGRMDKKVFVGPPDLEARLDALRLYLQGRPHEAVDCLQVAQKTQSFSYAELRHVVNEASRQALSSRRPIVMEDLLAAIRDNPPTLGTQKGDEPEGSAAMGRAPMPSPLRVQ